jgi:hypothetical protein
VAEFWNPTGPQPHAQVLTSLPQERGPAAMFAVLMILGITTIAGALRSDTRGAAAGAAAVREAQPPAAVIRSSSPTRRVR